MKQYLVVCDEEGAQYLSALLMPNRMQFIEVQGVKMNGDHNYNILITPVIAPDNLPKQDDAVEQSIPPMVENA